MKHRSYRLVRIYSHLLLIAGPPCVPFDSVAAQPVVFEIDAGHSYVGFVARHLMVAKVKGQFPELTGRILLDERAPDRSSVSVSLGAGSVDSNNDRRDRDIRGTSFLAVEQFPSIAFQSTSVEKDGSVSQVTGDLTIRGVTRRIVVPFQLTGPLAAPSGRRRLGVSASFTIDRRDYGITTVPEAIVGNDVVVEIEIEAHASPATPASAQTPEERAIDALFAGWTSSATPGCAVGAIRDNRLVFAKGYGMADLASRTPMTPKTILGVASVSKQFTAAAVALLVQEGRLKPTDDIRVYLPEIPSYPTPVLIRDLLHHTSGLRDYLSMTSLAGRNAEERIPREVVLELLGRQNNLNFPAGSAYMYSNTNYLLLSTIVERVSGIPFPTFMMERIFGPLGMSDSRFVAFAGDVVDRQAESYRFDDSGRLTQAPLADGLGGDGGAYMTVEDLARWEAHWSSPRLAPDGRAWVELMRSQPRFPDGRPVRYGWGTQFATYRGVDIETHGGTWAGFRAYYLRLPSLGFASVALCNQLEISPYELTRRIADIYVGARLADSATPVEPTFVPWTAALEPISQPVAADQVEHYAGRFLSEELDVVYVILPDSNGGLSLRSGWNPPRHLRLSPPDTLARPGVQLVARRSPEGGVNGYLLNSGRIRGIEFTRLGKPETALIVVPRSTAVTLDARLGAKEWADAARARMSDGSELMLQHDGRSLYVGIRAARSGFPSVCVMANDTTRILHASAALATGIYVRENTTWARKKPFEWALRDRTFGEATQRRQNAFADVEGWAGTTFHMSGMEKEMRIDLRLFDARNPRLAIGYFVANDGPVVPWPAKSAQDGCADQRVVSGYLPAQVKLDDSTWAKLEFAK